MSVTPTVRGLYLCNRLEVEPATSNLTLVDCFRTLVLPSPDSIPEFFAVAYLANGVGTVEATVRVCRLDAMGVVFAARKSITFSGRLAEAQFVGFIEQCVFAQAGGYEVSLWVGDALLAQTPIHVRFEEDDE